MSTILLLKERNYNGDIVDVMTPIWSEMGYSVINHHGIHNLPPADIVFLHINRTVVSPKYLDAVKGYGSVINAKAINISRRRYSSTILDRNDAYRGQVVVKTDANYGGKPELRNKVEQQHAFSGLFSRVSGPFKKRRPEHFEHEVPLEERTSLDPLCYPIFDDIGQVPEGVWSNKYLIVEKFLPEREKDIYYVRYWSFLGYSEWSGRFGSKNPIVKFGNIATPDKPIPVPDELRLLREKMGLDYGRFDFVVHDGVPYVLDINKTQGGGRNLAGYEKKISTLAAGIRCFG